MSQKKSGGGRPGAERVNPILVDTLKQYPFPDSPFAKDRTETYAETTLVSVVLGISDKIHRYALQHPGDDEVLGGLMVRLEGEDYKGELINARTLKRCLDSGKASHYTIEILEAFHKIVAKERESLGRVAGLYYVFAIHYTDSGTFQESVVKIGQDGNGLIKFMNRRYEVEQKPLKMERLGKHNLLLTLQESDFPLIFYLYLGEGRDEKYPFYQASYIYSNGDGNTIANLAVFQRIDLNKEEYGNYKDEEGFLAGYEPQRQLKALKPDSSGEVDSDPALTVRQNIQYFLVHHTRPVATKLDKKVPFDFKKSVAVYPGFHSNPTSLYIENRRFEGDYFIYFNERFPSKQSEDKLLDKSDFFSTVGQGVLRIWADEITGVLRCEMRTRKSERGGDIIIHEGEVVNDQLGNSDYLILSMYTQPNNQRYVNLLFRVINDNTLIGGFNIAYSLPGQLGVGTVIMTRVKEEEKGGQWKIPQTIFPSSYHSEDLLKQAIVNFLSRDRQAITVPVSYIKLKPFYQNFRYQGVYYMYSCRIRGGYRKSVLVISRNRSVKLITQEGHRAFGEVEHRGNALNITMRYEEKPAAGFCCIRVDGVTPRENYSAYSGTFAGIYPAGDEWPVASQFIVEFLGIGGEVEQTALKAIGEKQGETLVPEQVQKRLGDHSVLKIEENIYRYENI